MANEALKPTNVVRESLRLFTENLSFCSNVNRTYDNTFRDKGGQRTGAEITMRLPNKYQAVEGATLGTPQDTVESGIVLTRATQLHVPLDFSIVDLTMNFDDISDRVMRPAMATLASEFESRVMTEAMLQTYNMTNTAAAGTVPTAYSHYADARARLARDLVPTNDRTMHVSSTAMTSLVSNNTNMAFFNNKAELDKAYLQGYIGNYGGFKWFENQSVPTHTAGTNGTTAQVNGANQTGASLAIDNTGAATSTITRGTVFTIAGVNKVHPLNKNNMGVLQQFVVTEDFTASGSAGTLKFSPSIVTTGAKQTVTASPANDAVITFVGAASTAYEQALAVQKDCAFVSTIDLVMPQGVHKAARAVAEGVSMRWVEDYNINEDRVTGRVDIMFGAAFRPEGLCRITM